MKRFSFQKTYKQNDWCFGYVIHRTKLSNEICNFILMNKRTFTEAEKLQIVKQG